MDKIGGFRDRTQMIKCAGFGGQGILALGEILAIAGMHEGKNVSWLPSYGPESRGGTCNCDVILSEDEVAAPLVDHPNIAFIFNQPSMDKFEPSVSDRGVLLYDAGLARVLKEREGVRYVSVPFTTLSLELGTEKVANMVALGAYIGAIDYLHLDRAVAAMREKFEGKDAVFAINEKAIAVGIAYVSSH